MFGNFVWVSPDGTGGLTSNGELLGSLGTPEIVVFKSHPKLQAFQTPPQSLQNRLWRVLMGQPHQRLREDGNRASNPTAASAITPPRCRLTPPQSRLCAPGMDSASLAQPATVFLTNPVGYLGLSLSQAALTPGHKP